MTLNVVLVHRTQSYRNGRDSVGAETGTCVVLEEPVCEHIVQEPEYLQSISSLYTNKTKITCFYFLLNHNICLLAPAPYLVDTGEWYHNSNCSQ